MSEEQQVANQQQQPEQEEEEEFESFAKDAPRIIELINQICSSDEKLSFDVDKELDILLVKYLEQPTLLDPHLQAMVSPLMKCVHASHPLLNRVCRGVYNLCKTRGHKTIVKFFPHEVKDLEPAFQLLQDVRKSNSELTSEQIQKLQQYELGWYTEYVLLVWLSMLVLVPFNLNTIDSSMGVGDTHSSLISNLIDVCKQYLYSPGADKEGACLVLARLLTRPDMNTELKSFFTWSTASLGSISTDLDINKQQVFTEGVLMTLARIFKHAKRSEVLQHTEGRIPFIINFQQQRIDGNTSKLCTKVIQRIALLHLPPKVASWRYQRGMRTLENNLNQSGSLNDESSNKVENSEKEKQKQEVDEEEEFEVSECVEEAIDYLLKALNFRDTKTRWSAAKGIGRISSRLPLSFADEVVSGVLQTLQQNMSSDTAWHGSCLAIAEMVRRGVLLPARLAETIPLIVQALQFEVRRGNFSVGNHVRDAACYVCWAFARAYAPNILKPHVLDLAQSLLVTACFDREINCRRAAAAAFQENVGRQGTFPFGIEVVQKADYFALGNRNNAYLQISTFVAKLDIYRKPLITHLAEKKLNNWDRSIRILSSKALYEMAKIDPEFVSNEILPKLFPRVRALEPLEREGVVLGIAEIVLGLHHANYNLEQNPQNLEQIHQVIPTIQQKRLFRGKGGEAVREAVSRFIECIGYSNVKYPPDLVKKTVELLEENIKNTQEYIQEGGVTAYKSFSKRFFSNYDEFSPEFQNDLISKYILQAKDKLPNLTRGFSSLLGVFPPKMIHQHFDNILQVLSKSIQIQSKFDERDPETRRNAITALTSCAITFGTEFPEEFKKSHLELVSGSLMLCLDDYCVDNRGDVGSWCRIAAINAIPSWIQFIVNWRKLKLLSKGNEFEFPSIFWVRIIGCLIRQLTGKMDRVRTYCATCLTEIIVKNNYLENEIPQFQLLKKILTLPEGLQEDQSKSFWVGEEVLERCGELLKYDEYRLYVLEGWCLCTDQINGFKRSNEAAKILTSWCTSFLENSESHKTICLILINLCNLLQKKSPPPKGADPNPSRLIAPAVITLSKLFDNLSIPKISKIPKIGVSLSEWENKTLNYSESNDWSWTFQNIPSSEIVQVSGLEILKKINSVVSTMLVVKDFSAVLHSIYVLCSFAVSEIEFSSESLLNLLSCLTDHPWPRTRKLTADRFYVHLLSANIVSKTNDDICDLITTTSWIGSFEETQNQRTRLYAAFGIPVPERKDFGILEAQPQQTENDIDGSTYADLIADIVRGTIG